MTEFDPALESGFPAGSDPAAEAAAHARYSRDDAAYLAGALSEAEAAEYEAHLAGCPLCQAQLHELEPLSALLAGADPSVFEPAEPVPDTLLPRLLREVRARRRTQRVRTVLAAGIAACLIVLVGVGGSRVWEHSHQPQVHHFVAVGGGPATVDATVELKAAKSGTSLQFHCGDYEGASSSGYPSGPDSTDGRPLYQLVVINRAGSKEYRSTWPAGDDIDVRTKSVWPPQAIKTIQIVDSSGKPLLEVNLQR